MDNFDFNQSQKIFRIYSRYLGVERSKFDCPTYLVYDSKPTRWYWFAWASGPRVTVGPGYFRLTKRGQIAVLIHELLHIKYPPGKRRRKGGNRTHVHSGRWKQAALKWGERVVYVHDDDILPQWRLHPLAKEPALCTCTHPYNIHSTKSLSLVSQKSCGYIDCLCQGYVPAKDKCYHTNSGRRLEADGVWHCSRCGDVPASLSIGPVPSISEEKKDEDDPTSHTGILQGLHV